MESNQTMKTWYKPCIFSSHSYFFVDETMSPSFPNTATMNSWCLFWALTWNWSIFPITHSSLSSDLEISFLWDCIIFTRAAAVSDNPSPLVFFLFLFFWPSSCSWGLLIASRPSCSWSWTSVGSSLRSSGTTCALRDLASSKSFLIPPSFTNLG